MIPSERRRCTSRPRSLLAGSIGCCRRTRLRACERTEDMDAGFIGQSATVEVSPVGPRSTFPVVSPFLPSRQQFNTFLQLFGRCLIDAASGARDQLRIQPAMIDPAFSRDRAHQQTMEVAQIAFLCMQ